MGIYWTITVFVLVTNTAAILVGGSGERLAGWIGLISILFEPVFLACASMVRLHVSFETFNEYLIMIVAVGYLGIAYRTGSYLLVGAMLAQAIELFGCVAFLNPTRGQVIQLKWCSCISTCAVAAFVLSSTICHVIAARSCRRKHEPTLYKVARDLVRL